MTDIDLIPQEYRQIMVRLRDVRIAGIVMAVVVLISVGCGIALEAFAGRAGENRNRLAERHKVSEAQSEELTRLSGERDRLLQQRDVLTRLRGGAAVTRLMLAVDRALPSDDVWFLEWRFSRPGSGNEDSDDSFLPVIDVGKGGPHSNMEISGQAVDHAALSRFVRELFGQPEVEDVRVRQTTVRRYPTHSIVDFNLTLILRSKSG